MLYREELCESGYEAFQKIKLAIRKGNVTRVVVADCSGKVLLNIPVNFVAVGFLMSPFLVSCLAMLSLVRNCRLTIETGDVESS